MRVLLFCLPGLVLAACSPAGSGVGRGDLAKAPAEILIIKTSSYSVGETMDRLQAAVQGKGAHVFARIDHASGAQKAGLNLAPEQVLIFGNPKMGTKLMQQNPRIGLDLPIRVLVWRDGRQTKITYTRPAALGARYGIDVGDATLVKMGTVLDAVTEAARKAP